ncbi:hypothetical protein HETIRDRAFT_430208 [Heterobasidion irregulare TC 32-1]|uniref:Uncharacterized protein n=1 Tax=Heterobasidion irregulare (strain TC 32-1) TaxID=747525 RepID=W4JPY6_HETIT|nr:uncharacterized protein HETIRDRAFT_430208 [Heterobasidion irregulare TC 32-1]ETW75632.1 hypothetical protein HETIRDRAFT_430208 [Heterobasidion irregulare TC 32-1]
MCARSRRRRSGEETGGGPGRGKVGAAAVGLCDVERGRGVRELAIGKLDDELDGDVCGVDEALIRNVDGTRERGLRGNGERAQRDVEAIDEGEGIVGSCELGGGRPAEVWIVGRAAAGEATAERDAVREGGAGLIASALMEEARGLQPVIGRAGGSDQESAELEGGERRKAAEAACLGKGRAEGMCMRRVEERGAEERGAEERVDGKDEGERHAPLYRLACSSSPRADEVQSSTGRSTNESSSVSAVERAQGRMRELKNSSGSRALGGGQGAERKDERGSSLSAVSGSSASSRRAVIFAMLCARARSASAAEAGGWRFGDDVGTVTVERRRGLTSDARRGMENEGISCVVSRRRACAHRLGGGSIHVNGLGGWALGGRWAWTQGNEGTRARGFGSQARAGACAQIHRKSRQQITGLLKMQAFSGPRWRPVVRLHHSSACITESAREGEREGNGYRDVKGTKGRRGRGRWPVGKSQACRLAEDVDVGTDRAWARGRRIRRVGQTGQIRECGRGIVVGADAAAAETMDGGCGSGMSIDEDEKVQAERERAVVVLKAEEVHPIDRW